MVLVLLHTSVMTGSVEQWETFRTNKSFCKIVTKQKTSSSSHGISFWHRFACKYIKLLFILNNVFCVYTLCIDAFQVTFVCMFFFILYIFKHLVNIMLKPNLGEISIWSYRTDGKWVYSCCIALLAPSLTNCGEVSLLDRSAPTALNPCRKSTAAVLKISSNLSSRVLHIIKTCLCFPSVNILCVGQF